MKKKMSLNERLITSINAAVSISHGGKLVDAECPHCKEVISHTILPLKPVVVAACKKCGGHILPFVGLLLPLRKSVIENGSDVDRRFEITQAIMKKLHELVQGLFTIDKVETNDKIEMKDIPSSFEDLTDQWGI